MSRKTLSEAAKAPEPIAAPEEVQEQEAPKTLSQAAKYDIPTLRKGCMKVLGVTSSTFEGAFYGHDGEYTVEEAKAIIENWMKGEIKA